MTKTIDINAPLKISYCIPMWLRDEQIKQSIKRVIGRLQYVDETRTEPIAVVCFGPSLNDTWEKIKDFKYVISCSGAHKFLTERGIIPTWHCEVDPRPHKVDLMGAPNHETVYLIASTCHQAVFDHLEGCNVLLWHVFDSSEEACRVLPPGEWAVTGGSSVGLRALTLAHFLGFRDLHVFGMDGNLRDDGVSHASPHPKAPQAYLLVEYPKESGRMWKTTPSILHCAKETWHELNQMPKATATFYGDSLVAAMSLDYVRKSPRTAGIALSKPELISEEYRCLNAQLHRENPAYGVGGERHAPTVLKLAESLKTKNILDWGCGKGRLAKAIPWAIAEYDPAIPGKDESPKPADLVVSTDVLEHIEPDKILFVLDDLRRCVKQVGYFTIHTGPSKKTLPDGRNTHVLQRNRQWWEKMLGKFFVVGKIFEVGPELHVVVGPKGTKSVIASGARRV